jgi:hypothetical protein
VKLVEQWRLIERELPSGWAEATLDVVPEMASERPRAAALLGPANPGRFGEALRIRTRRGGGGVSPQGLRNLFGRLDEQRVWCSLRLVAAVAAETGDDAVAQPALAEADAAERTLTESWDAVAATLPPDWSDLHAVLRLRSTDYLDRAALLCAPLNPTRTDDDVAFAFRAARRFGYGASPEMVRRCLERCDAERMRGDVVPLRVLSDTHNVATQGPVWRVGGRSV